MIFSIIFLLVIVLVITVLLRKTSQYEKQMRAKTIPSETGFQELNVKKSSNNFSITSDSISNWMKEYHHHPQLQQWTNVVSSGSTKKNFTNRKVIENLQHSFSHQIPLISSITNQRKSGRCWIFSFLNMIKQDLVQKKRLSKDFELSENYLFFYDKLEKSNYFLNAIYQTRHLTIDDRNVEFLLKNYLSDGGTWNMLVNLIEKYGVVPKSNMRDTFHSGNSRELNRELGKYLKQLAFSIRTTNPLNFTMFMKKHVHSIFEILVMYLGIPPQQFDWVYKEGVNEEKDTKSSNTVYNLTPHRFYNRYIKFKSKDWIVCGNFPLSKYPFYQRYNINMCNNMVNGKQTDIFNIPIRMMLNMAQKSLDLGVSVWFACDFGINKSKEYSLLHHEMYQLPEFHQVPKLNKGDKLAYKLITPNHAMLIRGYNLHRGKINRWLVENSHGESLEEKNKVNRDKNLFAKGYYTMTSEWFRENVIQVVIPKKVLSQQILHLYETASQREVAPWESMDCQLLKSI